jgi:Tfp pilus assembly protein PilF
MKRLLAISIVGLFVCGSFALAQDQAVQKPQDQLAATSSNIQRADLLVLRESFAEAVSEYNKALALDPKDFITHNKLGVCYQRMHRLDLARKEYAVAKKLNPKYASAWNNYGTIYFARNDYKQAIKLYKKALALNPRLAQSFSNLGLAYLAAKQIEKGYEAYQQAVQIDPTILQAGSAGQFTVNVVGVDDALKNYFFAKLCAANGQVDEALAFLAKARHAGFNDFSKVEKDPDFKPLIQDARYQAFRHAMTSKL